MADKSSLELVWSKRVSDDEFTLQMDDRMSGHGFLPCYTGPNCHHMCTGLRRNTQYRFRLQAQNDEGRSPWSEEVAYLTKPDVPGPPLRPASKGRVHSDSFKVRWDPPADNGGSPVTSYVVELDDGKSGWRTVSQGAGGSGRGTDTECVCDGLSPGTLYKVRVACVSAGGNSQYSEVCQISTEPVCPGQCAPPRVHGKPKSTHLQLKWGWPESDGGSPVTEFEIDMTTPDNETRRVYRGGANTECVVASLLPGRPYLFQVRAHNKAGPGNWSESLEVISGAGAPGQPLQPAVSCKSGGTSALVNWEEPINNGALIQEFHLEMAAVRRTVVRVEESESEEEEEDSDDEDENLDADEDRDGDDSSSDDDDAEDEEEEEYDDESPVSKCVTLMCLNKVRMVCLSSRTLTRMPRDAPPLPKGSRFPAACRRSSAPSRRAGRRRRPRRRQSSKSQRTTRWSTRRTSRAPSSRPPTWARPHSTRCDLSAPQPPTSSGWPPSILPASPSGRTKWRYLSRSLNCN